MRSKISLILATQKAGSKPSRISFRRWEKLKRFSSKSRDAARTVDDARSAAIVSETSGAPWGFFNKSCGQLILARWQKARQRNDARVYCAAALDVLGDGTAGRFERIRDSTRLITLGSHSISMCGFSKARAIQE